MKKKLIASIAILIIIFNLIYMFPNLAVASVSLPNPSLVVSAQNYLEDGMVDIVIGITGDYTAYGVTYQFQYDKEKLTPVYYQMQGSSGSWEEAVQISDWAPITNDWSYYYSENNSHWNLQTGNVYLQTQSGTGINAHDKIGSSDYSDLENKYDGFIPVAICTFAVSEDFTEDDLTTNLIKLLPNSVYTTGFEIVYEDGGNKSLEDTSYIAYDGLKIASGGSEIITPEERPDYSMLPNPSLVVSTQNYSEEGMVDIIVGIAGDYTAYGVTYQFQYDKDILTPVYYKRTTETWEETINISDWAPITSDWSYYYSENNTHWDLENGKVYLQTQSGEGINAHERIGQGDYTELENKYDGFVPVAICSFKVEDGFTSEDVTKSIIKMTASSSYPTGFDIIYEDNGNKNLDDISYIAYDNFKEAPVVEEGLSNPALVVAAQKYMEDNLIDIVIGTTGNYKAYGVTYYFKYDTEKLTPVYYKRTTGTWEDATTMSQWAPVDSNWSCSYSDSNTYWNLDTGEVYLQTQSGTGINAYENMGNSGYTQLERRYNGFFPVAVCSFELKDGVTEQDLTESLISMIGTDIYSTGFDIIYEDNGNKNLQDTSYIAYTGFSDSTEEGPKGKITGSIETAPTANTTGFNLANIRIYKNEEVENIVNFEERQNQIQTGYMSDKVNEELKELTPVYEGQTNEDGTYEIDLEVGTYTMLIDKTGYLDLFYTSIEITEDTVITLENQKLYAGDTDKNGVINNNDIVKMYQCGRTSLGDENYEPACDFDNNDKIDNNDTVITYQNNKMIRQVINVKEENT